MELSTLLMYKLLLKKLALFVCNHYRKKESNYEIVNNNGIDPNLLTNSVPNFSEIGCTPGFLLRFKTAILYCAHKNALDAHKFH
jgi:hypothetical protein